MPHEHLRDEWSARERPATINPTMFFAPEGLVLGAGTILLHADGPRRLQSLRGQEARVLALLAAAYGRAVAPAVLGSIGRAVKAWLGGDGCLAHIHLAHSGLRPPEDLRSAACRLFIAESVMRAGMSPRAVLQAFKISSSYVDAVEKAYSPDAGRIPSGVRAAACGSRHPRAGMVFCRAGGCGLYRRTLQEGGQGSRED